jgi:hypothetical protein
MIRPMLSKLKQKLVIAPKPQESQGSIISSSIGVSVHIMEANWTLKHLGKIWNQLTMTTFCLISIFKPLLQLPFLRKLLATKISSMYVFFHEIKFPLIILNRSNNLNVFTLHISLKRTGERLTIFYAATQIFTGVNDMTV